MALVSAWENQGRKDACLNKVVKDLYQLTYVNNIDLKLHYIPLKCNPADFPSKKLTHLDCMLAPVVWNLVEKRFVPHSVDLMSLDSNAMRDKHGVPLRHFTPYPTPLSAGVNVFVQKIETGANPYVFPPFGLIFPLI